MIFMTKQWLGVGHSLKGESSLASSIKFHPVFLINSIVCSNPGIIVSQCSSTPTSSLAMTWTLNTKIGWNTWRIFNACLLPMKAVAMGWFSNILLTVRLSSGSTSHNIEAGWICGMVSQTILLASSGSGVSNRWLYHGFSIKPLVESVSGRQSVFMLSGVKGNIHFQAFHSLWLNHPRTCVEFARISSITINRISTTFPSNRIAHLALGLTLELELSI